MAFALRCPECRRSFRWNPKEKYPRYCQFEDCSYDFGEERADDDVVMPAFISAKTRSVDEVYRGIETSSIARAEKAAELAGCSVSEMSDMKVTNLRDARHEGEVAAVPVVNAVTQHMDMINARGGQVGWQGSNAAEYSSAVQSGPHPNAGAKMRSLIQRSNGMPENPALETLQPGYRIRG